MEQITDYLPQPTNWFSETLSYSGLGRIEFSNPKGWTEGEMTCEVNSIGHITAVLKIHTWEIFEEINDSSSITSRDWLLMGIKLENDYSYPMYTWPLPIKNSITLISVKTLDGGLLISDQVPYYSWDPIENIAELTIERATYTVLDQSKSDAKYWVVPCINLNLKHPFGATSAHIYKNLSQHPMRVFPVTKNIEEFLLSDASENDKNWIRHNLIAMNYIVGFFYNDEPAFIERLPNYNQIIHDLEDGTTRLNVTSLMIGKYSSEIDEKLPVDLLPVLGFATGRPVGGAWIEFRDDNANLVYRIHGNLGRYSYGLGRPIVHDIIHHFGLGKLITEAARSKVLSNSLIKGALRNSALAISSEDLSIMFYFIFTALDELFTYYEIEQAMNPLKYFLTQFQVSEIENILSRAKKDIEALKTSISDPNSVHGMEQSIAITKIANKVRSQPLEKRSQFADRLVALMKHFGLSDIEVLSNYYSDSVIWVNKVNKYRNMTMHATHFGNVFDTETRRDFEYLTPHLIDILIRILLKTLGYTGKYSPFVDSPSSSEELDWVKPTTSASRLGYK